MRGATFADVIVRRPNLRIPFPHRFAMRLVGARVMEVARRAKYLLVTLSSGETLIMHLGMSGAFDVQREDGGNEDAGGDVEATALDPHDHVTFRMSTGAIVTFNDVRRFGFMDLVPTADLASYPALRGLGLEPLSPEFNAAALARACKGKKTSLKAALLDQRVVAGLGNIYAVEALFVAGLSPRRKASTIATPTGAPRDSAKQLVTAIKQVLTEAIDRQTNPTRYRRERFRVYDREGERCRRRGCSGIIVRRTQAGRSTFYCPECQR
jgi:formamidopyrimidine-DNA glycosylase